MASRTSSRQVTFRRPFRISGLDLRQSAGTYTVDTEEELIEALSFLAWRRVATTMRVSRSGTTEFLPIDRDELDDALARDMEEANGASTTPAGDADLDLRLGGHQPDGART